jgi:hypothetical protein
MRCWKLSKAFYPESEHDECPGCLANSPPDHPLHFMTDGCSTTCTGCLYGHNDRSKHEGGCLCAGCASRSSRRSAHICGTFCGGCLSGNSSKCNAAEDPFACKAGIFKEGQQLTVVAAIKEWGVVLQISTWFLESDRACGDLYRYALQESPDDHATGDEQGDRVWVNDHYFPPRAGVPFAKAMARRERTTLNVAVLESLTNSTKTCWGCAIQTATSSTYVAHRKLGGCIRGESVVVVPDDEVVEFVPPKRRREERTE